LSRDLIFLNENHEVRSAWKFAIYVIFFLLIWVATAVGLSMLFAINEGVAENQLAILALNEVALFVPAVAAMLLTIRFVDRRPLKTFGIGILPEWRRHFISGLILAAAMLGVLMLGCKLLGRLSIQWTGSQVPGATLLATFLILLVAALNEELVFRGFPLQVLIDGVGKWPAMVIMSVLFGALHISNPNSSRLGAFNTILAGILLSLAYVRTRSLWLPYAIHVGWNVGLGFILGFALSGLGIASLWTTGVSGSDTILGGSYGPEGGLLGTFIFAGSALIVSRYGSVHSN
jgi:membrane protease YdiL (CAAX protease family)